MDLGTHRLSTRFVICGRDLAGLKGMEADAAS
jgi:hypothetical protein